VARVEAQQAASGVLFDRLRAQLRELERSTQSLTDGQLRTIAFRQTVANIVAVGSLVVALLVAALWAPVLRRLLVRPVQQLERQVQAVAAGAYEGPIEPSGPAEIGSIATAVDRMRDSLVRGSHELVETQHELTLRDERDRMAADLHDLTIQRVFALGLALSSTAVRQPRLAPLLEPLVEETDGIIRELRGVIFGIRSDAAEGTLRHRVAELVRDSGRGLGFTPALEFAGPVDSACDEQLAGEVLAVLREALSNVARHAQATRASIRVAVDGNQLTVAVSDDGVGLGDVSRAGHGLGNLRLRAVRLGGGVEVASAPGGGTALEWQVPLAPAGRPAPEQLDA
jgi:signal transduction histidine kinase